MKVIIGCSGAKEIAKKVAKALKTSYFGLALEKFPDNEFKVRFPLSIEGKEVCLVQSFYGNISDKILETLFAAYTAKDLGARKIILLATYFPYFRQDARFRPNESISLDIIKKLFEAAPFDKLLITEPHLHRKKRLEALFLNGKKISVLQEIATFIKNKIKQDSVLVGPDEESVQWVAPVAKALKKKYFVLKKKRFTARKVRIISKIEKHPVSTAIVIDDICSTGSTLLETVKKLRRAYKKIYCIPIHGIFVKGTLKKLKKAATVFSTNSIPSPIAKIDISLALAKALR